MARTSVKAFVKSMASEEAKAIRAEQRSKKMSTVDSYVNYAHNMGLGANNPLSTSTYGLNPLTRIPIKLEWMHRGSWVCGQAIDIPADDMTKAGIEYTTELPAEDATRLDMTIDGLGLWAKIAEVVQWGRLYGGCLGVVLIDGQDPRTPLRPSTILPGQFKGIVVLDRWQVEASVEDLVKEPGPFLGQPRYYRVQASAPALRNCAVHHTRVAFRHIGVPLPYRQALTENLWGLSVLERLYDRLVGFDAATAGISQLIFRAWLRTMKVKGFREIVATGGDALDGLKAYTTDAATYHTLEGVLMIDAEDELTMDTHQAFSGLDSALMSLGQQLSGALQIPLVRLFGQSPAGLNSSGESDLRTYYDFISQQQKKHLHWGVLLCYILACKSIGIQVPDDFNVKFKSLWEMSDTEKATTAKTAVDAITGAHDAGLISDKVAMQELKQQSRVTGYFSNISEEDINNANDQIDQLPDASSMLQTLQAGGNPLEGVIPNGQEGAPGAGSEGSAGAVPRVPQRRAQLLPSAQLGGEAGPVAR